MAVFKMRDNVPSARYLPVCNVLRQWKTSLIPIYRVYRLYDNPTVYTIPTVYIYPHGIYISPRYIYIPTVYNISPPYIIKTEKTF